MRQRSWHSRDVAHLLETLPLLPESPCPYYPERQSRYREFRFEGDLPPEFFEAAMQIGYRRCGDLYYQTNCRGCRACLAYRIPLATFAPNRTQRRVLRHNDDVELRIVAPTEEVAKTALYLRYKYEQHHLRPPNPADSDGPFDPNYHLGVMRFQMYTNPQSSRELQLWAGERLVGFGTLDLGPQSVSAVYFAFDMDEAERSPGTLAILRGMAWAREQGYLYYHLGFYIPGHPKMDYKRHFRPAEFLNRYSGAWEPCTPEAVAAYLA